MKPTGSIVAPNDFESRQVRDKFDFDPKQIRVGTPVRVGKKHRVRVLSSAYTTRFGFNSFLLQIKIFIKSN